MQIEVKARNDDGEIILEGKLNRNEVSFLIGYAVNDLMHSGVLRNLAPQENGDDDDAPSRINVPGKESLN